MKKEHRFYINGEWINSSSTELIEIENPSTEEVIGTISAGTKEDIDLAVAAAKTALESIFTRCNYQSSHSLSSPISDLNRCYQVKSGGHKMGWGCLCSLTTALIVTITAQIDQRVDSRHAESR